MVVKMESSKRKRKQSNSAPSDDFTKQQVDQAIRTFLSQFTILIQVVTILVVANVTIVGYGISEKFGGALLIGSFIPLVIIYMMNGVSRYMIPIIFSAVNLEDQLAEGRKVLLISTFVSFAASAEYLAQLKKIADIRDNDKKMEELHKMKFPMFARRRFNLILMLISATELVIPFYLSTYQGWKLF
jgi:hypothetical protein